MRTNGGGAFNLLSPRQPLTATPYAIYARGVNAAGISGTIGPANIANGTITSLMLANGAVGSNQLAAGSVTTGALAEGAVTAAKVATTSNWFALTIPNPAPDLFDVFGGSVAALGSDRVLIGAPGAAGLSSDLTAAYLFATDGTLLTTFSGFALANNDLFGSSVAIMGSDRVLIGAPRENAGATGSGAAYLFNTNGTALAHFNSPTPTTAGSFGASVAAVGSDRVLIGAPDESTGGIEAGVAYLYYTNGSELTALLIANPTPDFGDKFGSSVAALGSDRVLIGDYQDDTGAANAGAAYLFNTNGTLLTTFTNPTPANSEVFAFSVAALGSDRVLIGAYADSTGAPGAGVAYLFSTNGTLLTTFTNPTPANGDAFAYSVAAVGDRVLIGAAADDSVAPHSGAAYLFSTETFAPGLVADAVHPRAITTASLEDNLVTAVKLADGAVTAAKLASDVITSDKIAADTIVNADIRASAGIVDTKLATISTAGKVADTALGANVALLNRAGQRFTGTLGIGNNGTLFTKAQFGTATVGTGVAGANTFTITFPAAFSTTPKVFVTAKGNDTADTFAISTRAVTTSNFKVNIVRVDFAGGWGQTLQVDWYAVE